MQRASKRLPITLATACAALRREFVDATVVVRTAVNRGTVEISESIDDHAVIGKATIWRACEGVNNTLHPLTAANRTQFEDCADA